MCRLLYLPRNIRPNQSVLRHWLTELEESNGGHGSGLATMKRGSVKGLMLTPKASARIISKTTAPILWHTRLVSCGRQVDDLCHPFWTGHGWLAHNGHWRKGAFAAKLFAGDWSDSKVGALQIRLHGWKSFCNEVESGVWLHLTKRGLQLHYPSGGLFAETETGALCSQATELWGNWVPVKTGSYDAGESIVLQDQAVQNDFTSLDWLRNEANQRLASVAIQGYGGYHVR